MIPMEVDLSGQWNDYVASVIDPALLAVPTVLGVLLFVFGYAYAAFNRFRTPYDISSTKPKAAIAIGLLVGGPGGFIPILLTVTDMATNTMVRVMDKLVATEGSEPRPEPEPKPEPTPVDIDWSTVGLVSLCVLGVIVLLVAILFGATVWRDRRHTRLDQRAAIDTRLDQMRVVIDKITTRLGEVQTDPVQSLELYALLDIVHPESARFWEQWIEVSDKFADAERTREIPSGLRAEVDAVERTWKSAYANAERLGLSAVGEDREADASKAVRAIRLAENTPNEAEAALAWQRAAELLAALNLAHLPEDAAAAIATRSRVAITDGGQWPAYDPNTMSVTQDSTVPVAR